MAAEYWGLALTQVMRDVAEGRIASKREAGLVFIDVAQADETESPPPQIRERRSLTWSFVTSAERTALLEDFPEVAPIDHDVEERHAEEHENDADDDDMNPPDVPVELTSADTPNWGEVRARVGRTRRPPGSFATQAA